MDVGEFSGRRLYTASHAISAVAELFVLSLLAMLTRVAKFVTAADRDL